MSYQFKKINDKIVKLPLGVLICANCNYYYLVNDSNYCYKFTCLDNKSKYICQFCRDNNEIYEQLNIYYTNFIFIHEINKIREHLLLKNVINKWKVYHKKFKLLKKIIRHWIFMKKIYLNPYTEIGIIRIKLIELKWNKLNLKE